MTNKKYSKIINAKVTRTLKLDYLIFFGKITNKTPKEKVHETYVKFGYSLAFHFLEIAEVYGELDPLWGILDNTSLEKNWFKNNFSEFDKLIPKKNKTALITEFINYTFEFKDDWFSMYDY